MRGLFFTRAHILSSVDKHISNRRGRKRKETKHHLAQEERPSYGGKEIFNILHREGIEHALLTDIFSLYEEGFFSTTSSVGKKIVWYRENEQISDSYNKLRRISLEEHSIRVAENCYVDTKISRDQRAYVSLFGLLHDAGKSAELCEKYAPDEKGHERASALIIEVLFEGTPYEGLGKIISADLRKIADSKRLGKKVFEELSFYGASLHAADTLAREQELKLLEQKEYA